MPHPAITGALMLIASFGLPQFAAATAASPAIINDVAVFEPVPVTDNLSITAYGVIKDSRCERFGFCNDNDTLIIAAVLMDHGQRRGVQMELGKPVQVRGGTLTLSSTATPPEEYSAIPLKDYLLDYTFVPSSRLAD